jgi:hypothetical protein
MPTPLTLTGYQLSQVANAKLEELGMEPIPSQMVYNYIKKGYIAHVEAVVNGKTVKRVALEDAKVWLASYIEGKRNTSNSLAELLKEF